MAERTQDRENRQRPSGSIYCPVCHRKVTLYEETHEWDMRGNHIGYGPGTGECKHCNLAFLDDPWDGVMSFKIPVARDMKADMYGENGNG